MPIFQRCDLCTTPKVNDQKGVSALQVVAKDNDVGHNILSSVQTNLNNAYPDFQFTMEEEKSGELPFQDVLIHRHDDAFDKYAQNSY